MAIDLGGDTISLPSASTHWTVPGTLKVPPSAVRPASSRVLPLAVMAVYLGAPVGVALFTVMVTVPVVSA